MCGSSFGSATRLSPLLSPPAVPAGNIHRRTWLRLYIKSSRLSLFCHCQSAGWNVELSTRHHPHSDQHLKLCPSEIVVVRSFTWNICQPSQSLYVIAVFCLPSRGKFFTSLGPTIYRAVAHFQRRSRRGYDTLQELGSHSLRWRLESHDTRQRNLLQHFTSVTLLAS